MENKNQPPKPEKEPSSWSETVRYNDGQLSLEFRNEGDRINLSRHKYGDIHSPNPDQMTLVKTETGLYVLGRSVGIDTQEQSAFLLSGGLPEIIVGEPWGIPDVGPTDAVENVALRYKADRDFSSKVDREVNKPNPFDQYRDSIDKVAEQFTSHKNN